MGNTFIQEKLLPRLTFNPGLALASSVSNNPAQQNWAGFPDLIRLLIFTVTGKSA